MMAGGDAAEQVVRLSLEGLEVAVRISGEGAKNLAVILAAALREEHKTKGKARLTNLIKSGKELKVFSVRNGDLKKFSSEAKRYGVLYCALKDKSDNSDYATVDVIARAEDASKIQRIMERFELASVDKAEVLGEVQKSVEERKARANEIPEKSRDDLLADEIKVKPVGKGDIELNPQIAKTEKSPLSAQSSKESVRTTEGTVKGDKPSVRKKLEAYREDIDRKKGSEPAKDAVLPDKNKAVAKTERKER